MQVLYFHQHFTTPDGGGGTRSYEYAKRLIERGHQVTMICGSHSGYHTGLLCPFVKKKRQGVVDGIKVIEFQLQYSNHDGFVKRSITFLRFVWHAIKIVLFYDYDIVFSTSTPLTTGIPGIFAKLFRRKPFVFEVRDLWPELPKAMGVIKNTILLKMIDMLETWIYYAADVCIGLSPGIVDGIRKKVPKKKILLLPNGCDIAWFSKNNQRKLLPDPIARHDFVAVFSGAHGIANGLEAVLDVAEILKKLNRDDIKFLFVGEGRKKSFLQQRAASKELNNCIFMDPIPKREIPQLFRSVDVGLMILANIPAFYYGTSPNKFFDYIAANLPVIINYPGWLADLIEKYNCGFVVKPDAPSDFANILIQCADAKHNLSKISDNSKKLAEKYNRVILANDFVDLLEQVYYD